LTQYINAGLTTGQPVPVLLDLSKRVSAAHVQPVNALSFGLVLAMAPDGPPQQQQDQSSTAGPASSSYPLVYCLGGDNRWMCVSLSHVAGYLGPEQQAAALPALQQQSDTWSSIAAQIEEAATFPKAWSNHTGEWGVRTGTRWGSWCSCSPTSTHMYRD
jgi:hypothetical protein